MSTTHRIEGFVSSGEVHKAVTSGWPEDTDIQFLGKEFSQEGFDCQPATLIIGGKALTEEEHEAEFQWRAKAMVNDMARAGHLGMGPEDTYVTFESIRTIAAKYNIQLP
jgi:hypothetical protein